MTLDLPNKEIVLVNFIHFNYFCCTHSSYERRGNSIPLVFWMKRVWGRAAQWRRRIGSRGRPAKWGRETKQGRWVPVKCGMWNQVLFAVFTGTYGLFLYPIMHSFLKTHIDMGKRESLELSPGSAVRLAALERFSELGIWTDNLLITGTETQPTEPHTSRPVMCPPVVSSGGGGGRERGLSS